MKPTPKFPSGRLALFSLIFTFSIPLIGFTQTYSIEEQGLIDQLTICWDAWMEGIENNDPKIWYDKCPTKPDASMWWTNDGAPQQMDWPKRNWDIVSNVDAKWVDIRPVAIRIWDDIGMIQFYGYWQANTKDGKMISEYKRTEVFKNENGTWTLLGGQGTPTSSADAEPY
jgi:hypothetical protein